MKPCSIIALLTILFAGTSFSQQPIFSQYYAAGLFVNPAQAGLQRDFTISANYRSQWKSVDMPFKTFQISCVYPITKPGIIKKHLGGIALTLLNDIAGPNEDFISNGAYVATAYNVQLNAKGNNILAFALQGGFHQTTINTSNLRWSSQFVDGTGYDANLTSGEQFNNRTMYPVINAGLAWSYYKRVYSRETFHTHHGISISNINRPNESMFNVSPTPVPMLYQIHGGFAFNVSRELEICPVYLVRVQNDLLQTNTGAYACYALSANNRTHHQTKVIVGAWYRLKDSFIMTTGIQNGRLTCGFSYDRNTASFGRYMGNASAYEFSAAFAVGKRKGMKGVSTPLI